MPLTEFFQKQFEMIREFMDFPGQVVRCVRIDAEMKEIFLKALVKMEDDPDFPHAFIPCDANFNSFEQFFGELLETFLKEIDKYSDDLNQNGIVFETENTGESSAGVAEKFVGSVSSFSDSLPDTMGSLVFLLDPEEVTDKKSYFAAVLYLAENTLSHWVKYLVLDPRTNPVLQGIDDCSEKISVQTFYISPEQIEELVKNEMEKHYLLSPEQRRQYLGLLGAFAFGRKDYEEARRLQQRWVEECRKSGSPEELANGLYNLGNTQLAQGDPREAGKSFCRAIDICVKHNIVGLTPLVVTNLGVALHRQGRTDEAIRSFEVARQAFRAQNQLPGEAFALDNLAMMFMEEGKYEDAEKTWLEAISVYEQITSEAFQDVREAGLKDLKEKLSRLYETSGRKSI